MNKYFILLLSAMMLSACGGNKTQGNAGETTEPAAEGNATADAETVTTEGPQQSLLWGFITIDNDQLDAVEEYSRDEFYMAQEFLIDVVHPSEGLETYTEEWITAHCSPEVKQFLRDQYDYDGEGYAMWLMEGQFAGEAEYNTEVTGFGYGLRNGKPVYAVEQRFAFEGMESFVRNLYFGLERKGEDFVITSFEMNVESKDPTIKADN